MEVVYCDNCGFKINSPPPRADDGKLYCAKCAPLFKYTTTALHEVQPPGTQDDKPQRKPSQRLNSIPPSEPVDDPVATKDYAPIKNPAKFYFCETCGKRITDIDLDRGAGRDKKLKGVYCKNCAVGVMTVEFDAIKEPPGHSAPVQSPNESFAPVAKKGSATGISPASRPAGKVVDKSSVKFPAHDTKLSRSSERNATPPAAIAAGIGAVVVAIVLIAALSSDGSRTKEQHLTKVAQTPVRDAPQPPRELPTPQVQPVQRSNTEPVELTQRPDPEAAAKTDYYKMVKFDGLVADDIESRMAMVEAFLTKHGDSSFAQSARVLLSNLKKSIQKSPALSPRAENVPPATVSTETPAKPIQPIEPASAVKLDAEGLKQFAAILKQLSVPLRQNQLSSAEKMLDEKLHDPATAQLADMLRMEKADLADLRALRQRAIEALCSKKGSTVTLTLRGSKMSGTVNVQGTEVALALRDGLEMPITADVLIPKEVNTLAPVEEGAAKAEDLRRRGLLFLAAGDPTKAEDYFTQARDAGLGNATAPYFERIAALRLAEKEIAEAEAWKKAEALFASKNFKEAKGAYESLQHEYVNTTALVAHAELLKKRLDTIEEALDPFKSISLDLGNGMKMELVRIPAGEFEMGSNNGEASERPVHKVKISRQFYMGKYKVTEAQFAKVMGTNPSKTKGENLPVEDVTYDDAETFCKRVSAANGKSVRLPTEAEWEYACRAGAKTKFDTGDNDAALDAAGWFKSNSDGKIHPVGQKKPNAWGLYDMHGDMLEWCQDWYDDNYYAKSPSEDPQGPSQGGWRVARGGGWMVDAAGCESSRRYWFRPDRREGRPGFRIIVPLSK